MKYKIKHNRFSVTAALLVLVVLGVFGFVLGNMRDLLFGAPLTITTASNGATLTDGYLPVSGKATHARDVRINGRLVTIDREGNFSDAVLLSPGYNVITVASRDQFGKEAVKTYHLVLDESSAVAQVPEPSARYQQ